MRLRRSRSRLLGALMTSVVLAAAALFLALPALAAAPSGAVLSFAGDDSGDNDACMNDPCQGAAPGHTWSYSATTGGLATNDIVAFTFGSLTTDRLHAVAMPLQIDPNTVQVALTGQGCVDNGATHPASVTVDWANQQFSFPMPGSIAAGQTIVFCFTDSTAMGMPLTPSPDTTPYRLTYTEPGGSVTTAYRVLARRSTPPDGAEAAPPYMHLLDSSSNEVSNAGEAGTAKGFFDTTYTVVMTGTANTAYQLKALSGRLESGTTPDTVDPRVTVTCPASCTTNADGTLSATFTVSAGADDHFVISADCAAAPDGTVPQSQCIPNDIGVISFTATTSPPPSPSPSPTASVKPALPRAGRGGSGSGGQALVLVAAVALAGGACTWRLSRDRRHT